MLCQLHERLINVHPSEGGSFDVLVEFEFFAQSFSFGSLHLARFFQVCHVANQVDYHILLSIVFDFFLPVAHMVKRVASSYVETDHHCMGTFVEDAGDRPEGLLTCCIPNLKLNKRFSIQHQRIITKFNSYRHCVLLFEVTGGEFVKDAGFSDTSVANDDQFEEGSRRLVVVVIVVEELVVFCRVRTHCSRLINLSLYLRVHISINF